MSEAAQRQPTPEEAIAGLWREGDLRYLLLAHQEPVHLEVCRSRARRFLLNISRRWGKSMLLCVLAVEMCLQKPGAQVRYAAGTSDMVEEIIEPHMARIFEDAPKDLLPEYNAQKKRWTFPNGSQIRVAGCDDERKANRLRGRACDLAIVDEAGFIDCLDYVIKDVLLPQLITVDGRMLISSTPPKTPAHPFVAQCAAAKAANSYVHRTIEDASHIDEATREEFIREAGGRDSSTCQREYYARFVVDERNAFYPEFGEVENDIVVDSYERPPFFDAYVVGDIGFVDLTVLLFAYYDFVNATIVIEDEYVTRRATADTIDDAAKEREHTLWPNHEVYARNIDTTPIVLAELCKQGRSWSLTRKDDLEASVNATRRELRAKRIKILRRCKVLRAHVEFAIWNRQRTDLHRPASDEDESLEIPVGHFDGAAALHYLVRRIERHRDPYPLLPPGMTHASHFIHPDALRNPQNQAISDLFKRSKAS